MSIPFRLAALAAVLAASTSLPAQLVVESVAPARNTLGAPTAAQISIRFTTPVDRSTVTARTFYVFGRWSGVMNGAFAFSGGDRTITFTPQRPFFVGERVDVALSSAVRGAAAEGLPGGHAWSFWTASAPGSGELTRTATLAVRRPGEGLIQTYGAYAGDLDRDGAPDLSLPNETSNDVRVMRNDGCGAFSLPIVHALPVPSRPSTNEGHDFNGDGATDLAVGNISGGTMAILLGNGAGSYQPAVTYPSGGQPRGLAVLDADGDGDVDVVTANRATSNLALHRNAGDGTFLPAQFFDGGGNGETAVTAADANSDGIPDLLVGNYNSSTVTLLRGRGDGTFALSSTQSVPTNPWMIAAGDVDGDGQVDAVVCCAGAARASLVRGDGNGALLPSTSMTVGNFPLAVDLGDLDGDGDLDLLVSNFSSTSFTGYWNQGGGVFGQSFTLASVQAGSCALFVDYDRDGDLDILGIDELADVVLVFSQVGPFAPGVQPASCTATLRVDNLANRAGFGAAPPHPVARGRAFFIGITGGPAQPFAVLLGLPSPAGVPLSLGLLHLAPAPLLPFPAGLTNGFGEAQLSVPLPASLPAAVVLGLQAGIADPSSTAGATLTNPEQIVLQ